MKEKKKRGKKKQLHSPESSSCMAKRQRERENHPWDATKECYIWAQVPLFCCFCALGGLPKKPATTTKKWTSRPVQGLLLEVRRGVPNDHAGLGKNHNAATQNSAGGKWDRTKLRTGSLWCPCKNPSKQGVLFKRKHTKTNQTGVLSRETHTHTHTHTLWAPRILRPKTPPSS